jgi:hypothetical protein
MVYLLFFTLIFLAFDMWLYVRVKEHAYTDSVFVYTLSVAIMLLAMLVIVELFFIIYFWWL